MSTLMERDDPFVFVVQLSHARRNVALTFATFFLLIAAYFPLKIGLVRFSYGLKQHPALWAMFIVFAAAIAFFLGLAFPPRAQLAKLQVGHDSISFIPAWAAKFFLGESAVEAAIPSQSKEILLCQNFLEKSPGGYSVIIRAGDKAECAVKAESLALRTAQEVHMVTEGIAAATGLPVRFTIRRRFTNGTVEEVPWVAPAAKTNIVTAGLAMAATPWVAGIIIGHIFPSPAMIVAVGLALWLVGGLISIFAFDLRSSKRSKSLWVHMLATFFTLGASYAAAVAIAAALSRSP